MRPQPLAETEGDQHARCIGRELDAGADLLQPLGLLETATRKPRLGERQRRRQPADPGAGDHDGARGRHGRNVSADGGTQAVAISVSAHSGGRAACGSSAGS